MAQSDGGGIERPATKKQIRGVPIELVRRTNPCPTAIDRRADNCTDGPDLLNLARRVVREVIVHRVVKHVSGTRRVPPVAPNRPQAAAHGVCRILFGP